MGSWWAVASRRRRGSAEARFCCSSGLGPLKGAFQQEPTARRQPGLSRPQYPATSAAGCGGAAGALDPHAAMAEEAMALAAAALPPPVPLLVRVPGHGVRMWDTAGSRPSVGNGVPAAAVAGRSAGALAAGQPDALGSSGAVNSRDPDGGSTTSALPISAVAAAAQPLMAAQHRLTQILRIAGSRSKSMAAAAAASQPALLQPTSAALYPAGAGYSVGNSAAGPSSSGSCRVQPLDLPSGDLSSGWEAEWQDGLGFPPPQLEADEALGGGAPAPAAASSLVPPGCVPAGGRRLGVPSPPSDRMDVLSWLCEGTHELLAGQPDLSNLDMLGDTVLVVLWQPSSARVDASGTRRTVRRLAGGAAGATDGSGAFLLLHLTCHHQLLVWRAAGRGGAAAAAAAGGSGGAADGGVSDGGRRLAPLVSVTPKQAESLGESFAAKLCLARLPAGTAVIVTTNVTSGGYRQHVAPHYMFDPSRTAGGQVQGQGQGSACGAIALARLLRVGPPTRLGASGDGGRVGDLRVPVMLDKASFMWVPFKRYSDLVMDLGFSETIQSQVRRVGQDPLRQRLYTGARHTVELMQQRHQQRHQQRKQEQGQRQVRRQVQHQEQRQQERQQERQQLQQQGAAAAASGAAAAPSAPTTAAYAAGGEQPRLLEPLQQSLAPYVGGIHFLAAQAAAAITAPRGHGAASGDRSSSAPAATPLGLVGARPATMLPPLPPGPLLPPRPPPAAAAGAAGQAGSFSRPPPPPAPAHLLREGWGAAAASAAAAGLGLAGVPVYGDAMRALHNLQQKEEQRRHFQERRQAGSGVQGLAEPSEQPPVADMLSETTICPRQRAQTVVETHAMPAAASGAGLMVAGAAQPLAGCSKPGPGGAAAAAAQPAGGWRLPDGSSSGGGGRGGLATAAGPSHPVPAALGAVHAAAAAGAHAGMQAELCDSGGGRGSSQSGASARAPCGQDLDSAAAAALVAAALVYQRPASRNDTSSTPAATPLGLVGARPATMLPPQPSGPLLPPAAAAGAAGQAGSFSRSLSRGPRAFAPPASSGGLVEEQRSMPPPPRPPPPPAPAHLLREGWGAAAASAAAAGLGLAGVDRIAMLEAVLYLLQREREAEEERALREPGDVALAAARSESC
ncbi:hypothetical protein HYH02_004757 [Chlamydomonas schloesseri]|uniref:Uncharacterized protein n=1 Tax=Chlamydomonas schloesseri TaxID=2026947 RepID=A0A835WNU5_9CHLO|nr:hypothetical protein HYH02_004757 [Chlamydomonas schloesseri]|eukprot:KAG2450925.1 hypothetical protein HYH02_004757 [Chlamydomonas schloesseri]